MTNKMKDIIVIGAGGHGAELADYFKYESQNSAVYDFNVIGYLDDDPANYSRYQFSAPLLGAIRDHQIRTDLFYVVGIANLDHRKPIVERFLAGGARFSSFIHGSAFISDTASLGQGVVIAPMANIGPNVEIGDFTLVNARSSMGHDTIVGDYNVISPNVCFSGFTKIGDENLFGINSATIPAIEIGSRNKIAAGMVVHKQVGDDTVVFYRYKEKVYAIRK